MHIFEFLQEFKERNTMWRRDDATVSAQPARATMAKYGEAVDEFSRNATALIEQIASIAKARESYEEALRASAELRSVLDRGDETLRTLMDKLERAVNTHVAKPAPDKKKPEAVRLEPPASGESTSDVIQQLP
jgi:hypothetical protein